MERPSGGIRALWRCPVDRADRCEPGVGRPPREVAAPARQWLCSSSNINATSWLHCIPLLLQTQSAELHAPHRLVSVAGERPVSQPAHGHAGQHQEHEPRQRRQLHRTQQDRQPKEELKRARAQIRRRGRQNERQRDRENERNSDTATHTETHSDTHPHTHTHTHTHTQRKGDTPMRRESCSQHLRFTRT